MSSNFWMGKIFKVKFLRCAQATGGIHLCSWCEEGRATDIVLKLTASESHGALSRMQRWSRALGDRHSIECGSLHGGAYLPLGPGPLVVFCGHVLGSPACDRGSWWYQGLLSRSSWALRPSCPSLLQTSEEIFQHLQNIVDFGKNVMKEFLGDNYVHCGVSDLF